MANKLQAKFNLTGSNAKQIKKKGFQNLNIYRGVIGMCIYTYMFYLCDVCFIRKSCYLGQ